MLKHRRLPIAVVVVSLLFVADVAMAQDAPSLQAEEQGSPQSESSQTEPAKNWKLKFAPIFFWAPLNSTTASEGTSEPPETVTEGQTGLNAAYAGRLEYQWGRWFVSSEILFASVTHERTGASGTTNSLDFTPSLSELYGGWQMGHDLNLVGGARQYRGKLSFTRGPQQIERDDHLTDPVVGISWRPQLSKTWSLDLTSDIGGFGVGFDLSSSQEAVFTWQFANHFGLDVGYRAIYMKLEDSSGTLKTTFYGPVFGLEILF